MPVGAQLIENGDIAESNKANISIFRRRWMPPKAYFEFTSISPIPADKPAPDAPDIYDANERKRSRFLICMVGSRADVSKVILAEFSNTRYHAPRAKIARD